MDERQREVMQGKSLVVVVMMVVLVPMSALADLIVSSQSEFCSQHPTFLSCDFKGTQEIVLLQSLQQRVGKTVNTVYMQNAGQVVVEDICIGFVGFNLANITYITVPKACNPGQQFTFKLVDSTTNLVPSYVTQLDLQKSAAKDVTLTRSLKSLSVVHSYIGNLEVSQPLTRLKAKLEHSVIDNLEKLHLEAKSHLVLYNVTINNLNQRSLHLTDSAVNIWGSSIQSSVDRTITLGHRGSLTLKDVDGRVTLTGPEEMSPVPNQASPQSERTKERSPPGVPPQTANTSPLPCKQPSILLWVIPMSLAAIEAIVIIVNCTNWFPALKGRRVPRGLEEGGTIRQRQPPISYQQWQPHMISSSHYNSWYYNNEVPTMPRQPATKGFDKTK